MKTCSMITEKKQCAWRSRGNILRFISPLSDFCNAGKAVIFE